MHLYGVINKIDIKYYTLQYLIFMNKEDIDFINSISNIGTSKFTTETYKENVDFKKRNNR